MTSSKPCESMYGFNIGFLWRVLVLFSHVTSRAQILYSNYQRVDTITTDLARAMNVVMETATLVGCATKCSESSHCTGIVWDSVGTSCTIGVFDNSTSGELASNSTLYVLEQYLKCRFDLGYELRSYNDVTRCLRISNDHLVFSESMENCVQDGGRLYKANSMDHYNLVKEMLIDKGLYPHWTDLRVGLDDIAIEGHFVWSDGQSMTNAEKIEMFPGVQPDNYGNEDCAQIRFSIEGLNDCPCNYHYRYICELVM